MPALLKAKSSRPKASTVLARAAFTSSARVTSHWTASARPPCSSIRRAVSWLPCSDTSAATTLAPWRANASAAARPMPLAAPVTKATFPVNFPISFVGMICSSLCSRLAAVVGCHCGFNSADVARARQLPAAARAESLAVQFVSDMLHPLDHLAVELLLDCDVRHCRGRRGTMPVFLAGREPNHVARPYLLDRAAPALHPTTP